MTKATLNTQTLPNRNLKDNLKQDLFDTCNSHLSIEMVITDVQVVHEENTQRLIIKTSLITIIMVLQWCTCRKDKIACKVTTLIQLKIHKQMIESSSINLFVDRVSCHFWVFYLTYQAVELDFNFFFVSVVSNTQQTIPDSKPTSSSVPNQQYSN